MNTVKWGMIGCGQVTEVKSGPGLYKSENSELYGVFDPVSEKATSYAKRHNVKKVFDSVEDMLKDENINVIYIATPPKFHKDYVLKALNNGKIAYVEKPIALSYEESLEIYNLSKEKNIPVYVAFYRRGQEKFKKIKQIISNKEIGNLRVVRLTHHMKVEDNELDPNNLPWRLIKDISGGGKFIDMDLHVLDIVQYIVGDISEMKGYVTNLGKYYDVDDTVVASLKFDDGVYGSGSWCYVADKTIDLVELIGDEGRIEFSGLSELEFKLIKNGKEEVYKFDEVEHAAMPYEQEVINEIIGKEKSAADFEQALRLSKLVDNLYER